MELSNILIFDNVLENPNEYIEDALSKPFIDISDGTNIFKGIQLVEDDEIERKVKDVFTNTKVVYNFIRQSPKNQSEPNYIHSDKNDCDIIAILYLNKDFPKNAGTTIYESQQTKSVVDKGTYEKPTRFKTSVKVSMKYNRLITFPSDLFHSRNIQENFGTGDSSRLVQVLFLNYKNKQDE